MENKFVKFFILLTGIAMLISIGFGMWKATMGSFFENAGFIGSAFTIIIAIGMVYLIVKAMRWFWTSLCVVLIVISQGCNYAKSNQQVVVSTDCGMTWKKVNAGDAVPKGVANACFMKVVMPNYPMQGDSRFISNLKDRVRAYIHIDYDYSIIDPLAFIKQAKYLGKANTDADSEGALDQTAFEGAENMVIDKRIRDVGKSMFLVQDIVELDQADLENDLMAAANKVLEPLGVRLNFITLTIDPDEQTRQAIDVATAMKIYESKGLSDVGKQVMVQRAGATKVTVENKVEPAKAP